MKVTELITTLKQINAELPFESSLTDGEVGPFCQHLTQIKFTAPDVELKFGDGQEIEITKAISKIEDIAKDAPANTLVSSKGDDGKQIVLQKVYHNPPVTILEF
mgnify:CR=1 FL=1